MRVRGCKQGDAGKECRGCGLWGAGERVQVRNASEGVQVRGCGQGGVGEKAQLQALATGMHLTHHNCPGCKPKQGPDLNPKTMDRR